MFSIIFTKISGHVNAFGNIKKNFQIIVFIISQNKILFGILIVPVLKKTITSLIRPFFILQYQKSDTKVATLLKLVFNIPL